MFSILLILLTIVSVFMIGLILLQKSEGSGMSGSAAASMFGGALTGSAAGNFLTKLTAWLAVVFFVLCGALAVVSSNTTNKDEKQIELHQELNQQEIPGKNVAPGKQKVDAPVQPVKVDKK
ncbi:MAG: preprotein translocase subunit SecG [Alphaproteobacteria bacterium]|nr:preprotein translocase subunit SecG [Alphaproteobacteria bacterium]